MSVIAPTKFSSIVQTAFPSTKLILVDSINGIDANRQKAKWKIGQANISVIITQSPDADFWRISLDPSSALSLSNASKFISGLGGEKWLKLLPKELTTFKKAKLASLAVYFYDETGEVIVKMNVDSNERWSVLPNQLTISNLHFNPRLKFNKENRINVDFLDSHFGGKLTIADVELPVKVSLEEGDFVIGFANGAPVINFSDLLHEMIPEVNLPLSLPSLALDKMEMRMSPSNGQFSLAAGSANSWELPIGISNLKVDDIAVSITSKKPARGKRKISGSLGGTVHLGGVNLDLNYNFPGDFKLVSDLPTIHLSALLQDLCGANSVIGFPAPTNMMNIDLKDIHIEVAPQTGFFSVSGSSPIGQTEVAVSKNRAGKWGFTLGFAPPNNWRFSAIDSGLSVLDDLDFRNTAMIISSSQGKNIPLNIIEVPKEGVSVQKGVNLFASLNLQGMGIDDLMDIQSLNVYALIGTNPAALVLEAGIDGNFPVAENIAFGDMRFRLQPFPANFSLGVRGSMLATLDNSPLKFTGGMDIKPIDRSASFMAMMEGNWDEPFGTKGLSIFDLALEVGIGIVPPPAVAAPIIGFAGGLKVGNFTGSAAVKLDTVIPSKSMLALGFNEIHLPDIIQTFTQPKVYNSIPADIRNTVLDIGFEDVDIYVVPQPTQIADIHYDPGIRLKGKVEVAGIAAEADLEIDYTKGVYLKAGIDPIKIGSLFELKGVNNQPRAMMELDLRLGSSPKLEIAAAIRLLGLERSTYVSISDQGFYFMMEGKIFNVFEARLDVKAGNLKKGGDFYVKAALRNDLLAYLRKEATQAIKVAAEEATRALTDAQNEVDNLQRSVNNLNTDIRNMRNTIKRERERDERNVRNARNTVTSAQSKVNRLNRDINNMRNTIRKERERDAKRIRDARNKVAAAQNEVNKLNRNINNMRNTIRKERERDAKRIRDARNKVTAAQNEVNKLQREINSSKNRIRQLERDIAAKRRWFDNSKWYEKTYRWAEFSAYAAAKGAEITAIYTKIGGIETAKATAVGALEIAKQVLRGIEAAANTFPIDADPRIAGLFTAKESANLALEAAKQVLRGIEAAANTFPIDADPRIVGLFTAKESANLALEAAKQVLKGLEAVIKSFPIDADPRIAGLFTARESATLGLSAAKTFLEGLKKTVGAAAAASTFIVEQGLGGILDVRAASFEGQLGAVQGGAVALSLDLVFMKQNHHLDLAFNFKNPLKGAQQLAQQLLS